MLFIAFLAVVILIFAVTPEKSYSSSEKRMLSGKPELNAKTLADGSFMDGLEDYAADQFPLRDMWMQLKTAVSRFLGAKESQGVYLLKNGGLAERFTMPDETNYEETLTAICDFSGRYPDASMYFLMAPNAVSVLQDQLPKHAVTDSQNEYIDRLYNDLSADLRLIDVRPAFRAVSAPETLYYRTDHHWTTGGAQIAWNVAKDIMSITSDVTFTGGVVTNSFVGSLAAKSGYRTDTPDEISIYLPENAPQDFVYTVNYPDEMKKTASVYDIDCLASDDPYTVFFGSNHPLVEIDTSAESDRKLLVIKDSYANSFIPFALTEFSKITLLDPRYFYDDIDVTMQAGGFTDVLFLYNVNTFSADTNLKTVLKNVQ